MNEGSNSLEGLFENMSEAIETIVTFISFKGANGIKSLSVPTPTLTVSRLEHLFLQ
mgnify:CR=1 FL=1